MVPTATYDPGDCHEGVIGAEVCQADNASDSVYTASLSQALRDGVEQTLNQSYETTDLDIQYTTNPVYSADNNAETDIIYLINDNLPSNALARTYCEDRDGGGVQCDQHYVEFDRGTICATWDCTNPDENQRVGCHETGHAVGLTHGSEAYPVVPNDYGPLYCLRTPAAATTRNMGADNEALINATY